MNALARLIQRLVLGNPRRLAREAQRREWLAGDREARRFASQADLRPGPSSVPVGHVLLRDGTSPEIALARSFLRESHVTFSGATGSGKSTAAVDFTDRLLEDPGERLLGFDPKGDVSRALRELYFPARAASQDGDQFADRLRYLRLFAPGPPAPVRLTSPEPGVAPAVQATSLATALAESMGVELSLPAVHTFSKLARVAIECDQPLTSIARWIARPGDFARIGGRSRDEDLRHYALHEFAQEHRGVLRSLRTRIESVLLLPSVRAALEAPACLDFARALEDWNLLVDLSNPPAGEEAAVRMLGGPIFGRFARVILNRRVGPHTPHVWLFVDELPEVLGAFEATGMDRLLALCRSRLVSVLTISQHSGQLPRKLRDAIRTNTGVEVHFRASEADAMSLATVLPVPEAAERPVEVRRALVRRVMGLKRREAALWVKTAEIPLGFIRTPQVDFDELKRRSSALSAEGRARLGAWPASELPAPPAASEKSAAPEPPVGPPSDLDVPEFPDPDFPNLG